MLTVLITVKYNNVHSISPPRQNCAHLAQPDSCVFLWGTTGWLSFENRCQPGLSMSWKRESKEEIGPDYRGRHVFVLVSSRARLWIIQLKCPRRPTYLLKLSRKFWMWNRLIHFSQFDSSLAKFSSHFIIILSYWKTSWFLFEISWNNVLFHVELQARRPAVPAVRVSLETAFLVEEPFYR